MSTIWGAYQVAGFPGKKKERETGFESGSAKNTSKGRLFLAPPVRSPTPGPTDSAVNISDFFLILKPQILILFQ